MLGRIHRALLILALVFTLAVSIPGWARAAPVKCNPDPEHVPTDVLEIMCAGIDEDWQPRDKLEKLLLNFRVAAKESRFKYDPSGDPSKMCWKQQPGSCIGITNLYVKIAHDQLGITDIREKSQNEPNGFRTDPGKRVTSISGQTGNVGGGEFWFFTLHSWSVYPFSDLGTIRSYDPTFTAVWAGYTLEKAGYYQFASAKPLSVPEIKGGSSYGYRFSEEPKLVYDNRAKEPIERRYDPCSGPTKDVAPDIGCGNCNCSRR